MLKKEMNIYNPTKLACRVGGRRIWDKVGRLEKNKRRTADKNRRHEEKGRRLEEKGRRFKEKGRKLQKKGRRGEA